MSNCLTFVCQILEISSLHLSQQANSKKNSDCHQSNKTDSACHVDGLCLKECFIYKEEVKNTTKPATYIAKSSITF